MQHPSEDLWWADVLEQDGGWLLGSLALDEVCWLDGNVALIARGVVDDETVEQFERRLDSAVGNTARRLIIDLSACQLASAGLAALIRLQRRSSSRLAGTPLVATDLELVRMLQIVGLASRFRVYATLDAALHSSRRDGAPAARLWSVDRAQLRMPAYD